MEKAQAFIAFRDFCSELVSLLTQVSSNTTFQAMCVATPSFFLSRVIDLQF